MLAGKTRQRDNLLFRDAADADGVDLYRIKTCLLGGQDAFDGWGALRVRVFTAPNTPLDDDIDNLGLAYAPGATWQTTTPHSVGPVHVPVCGPPPVR